MAWTSKLLPQGRLLLSQAGNWRSTVRQSHRARMRKLDARLRPCFVAMWVAVQEI